MTRTMTRTRTSRTGMADGMADGLAALTGRRDEDGDLAALWKLATWLSPAYPVGAFAYSHGLEFAISAGEIVDAGTAAAWIADCIEHGAGRNDAILLAQAWHAEAAQDGAALGRATEVATALAPSSERLLETQAQGTAFAEVTGAAWGPELAAAPYPVAVGRAAAGHAVALRPTLLLYLHAFASTLVSACVRLVPVGQTDGQKALAALMPLCECIAADASTAGLDDIGGCAFRAEIAAMRHETQSERLFRT